MFCDGAKGRGLYNRLARGCYLRIQRDQRTAIVAGRDGDRDAANRSRGQSKDAGNLLMDNHFIQGADWSSRSIVRILDRA